MSKRVETNFTDQTEEERLWGYKVEKVMKDNEEEVVLYNGMAMEEFDQLEALIRSRYQNYLGETDFKKFQEKIAKLLGKELEN